MEKLLLNISISLVANPAEIIVKMHPKQSGFVDGSHPKDKGHILIAKKMGDYSQILKINIAKNTKNDESF